MSLDKDDIELLNNGLKFIPTPRRFDSTEFAGDIAALSNKIKWNYAFENKTEHIKPSIVSTKSNKLPPKPKDPQVNLFIKQIENIKPVLKRPEDITPNMTKRLYKSLDNLIKCDLVIKAADKGSGVVIMDHEFYNKGILDMISDSATYETKDMDCGTLTGMVESFVNRWNDTFIKAEKDAILKEDSDMANFYGLPKIHKSKLIQEATLNSNNTSSIIITPSPSDLKFRPIVACTKCPTTKLCVALDSLLVPFIPKLKYCIKDTWHFLRRCPKSVHPDTFSITADITSLYTNITTERGREAITYFYNQYPGILQPRFSLEFLLELYEFCQNNLYFIYEDTTYRQRSGTGMGRVYAPILANIKVAHDEVILEEYIRMTFSEAVANYFLNSYCRFLDDIYFQWRISFDNLVAIKSKMGDIDPKIKYEFSSSLDGIPQNSIAFLDVMISINNSLVETDIYAKATDTFNYVPFSSSHPRHVTRNIPFTLAKRIRGIVSNDVMANKRLQEMQTRLINKNYPKRIIKTGVAKALKLSRDQIINPPKKVTPQNETSKMTELYFVSTFNERSIMPKQLINNTVAQFNNNSNFTRRSHIKIKNSFRKSPNLKDLLVHRKKRIFNVKRCIKGCTFCDYILEGSSYTLKNGKTVHTNGNFECSSRNLIYVVICCGCNEFYIGETGDKLKSRFAVHRQQGKSTATLKAVSADQHFRICGKNEYGVFPFYRPRTNSLVRRRVHERSWIDKLHPKLNGLANIYQNAVI